MAKKTKTDIVETTIATGSFDLSKETDKFGDDMSDFLDKSCGLDIQTLNERDGVPYWINSGSYGINWIVGNNFKDGIPGTKIILVSGQCLGPDEELFIKVPKEIAEKYFS